MGLMGLADRKQVGPTPGGKSQLGSQHALQLHTPLSMKTAPSSCERCTEGLHTHGRITIPPTWRSEIIPLGHRFKLTTFTDPQDRCQRTTQPPPALPTCSGASGVLREVLPAAAGALYE